MTLIITFLLIGILAGILSGLFGVGGGIIVVPTLAFLFKYKHLFADELMMHMAVGTSLAIMIFTTSSSANAYYKRGFIVWPLFIKILPGLCVGMIVGALFAKELTSNNLMTLFALFLIVIAIYLFFSKIKETKDEVTDTLDKNIISTFVKVPIKLSRKIMLAMVPILIGLLSTMFGIGGGLLMIPFFLLLGFNMRQSSGTTSLCGIPIAILGTIILTLTGESMNQKIGTPFGTTGFIYWPAVGVVSLASIIFAPIGTSLSLKFPQRTLKRLLSILLVISAVNLLFISL